jgi:hypothetical protein
MDHFSLVKTICFCVEGFGNRVLLPSTFALKQIVLPHRNSNPDLTRDFLQLRGQLPNGHSLLIFLGFKLKEPQIEGAL